MSVEDVFGGEWRRCKTIVYDNKKSVTITPIVNSFLSIVLERCCGVTGSRMMSESVLDDVLLEALFLDLCSRSQSLMMLLWRHSF